MIFSAAAKDQKIAAFGSSYSDYMNLTEISWLAGRHRQQAGFHRRAKAKRMLFTTQWPSVSSPKAFDLAVPAPSAG